MSSYILDPNDGVSMNPFDGVRMSAMEAEKMTLSIVDMDPGAVIAEHHHPHEQIGYLVSGEAQFVIDGETYQVCAGQTWRLPGGVRHKVIAGPEGIRAIDVFYPIRTDMRGEQGWGKE